MSRTAIDWVAEVQKPEWWDRFQAVAGDSLVESVKAEPTTNWLGEPAVRLTVVLKPKFDDNLPDWTLLAPLQKFLFEWVYGLDEDQHPLVSFVSHADSQLTDEQIDEQEG